MSITVKNRSLGYIMLPMPFGKTVAAGASVTAPRVLIGDLDKSAYNTLTTLQNQGKITVSEVDDTTERGTFADASIADVHQVMNLGQSTATAGTVEQVITAERSAIIMSVKAYFPAAPNAGDGLSIDLKRNGVSIMNAALTVASTDTPPSKAGVVIPDDTANSDGVTAAANPTRFVAAGATFTTAHIGSMILLNSGNANDGAYVIATRVNATTVTLRKVDGTAPSFIDATGQHWDMILAVQPGDILAFSSVVTAAVWAGLWSAQVVLEPR